MKFHRAIPAPPFYRIDVIEELTHEDQGFLRRVERRLVTVSPEGAVSKPFLYDEVERRCLDAVVVVPHFLHQTEAGPERCVVLRSALRPPVALRSSSRSPIAESENRGLWEVPAGLVDEEERGQDGLLRAAARELAEETGFFVSPDRLRPLGPSALPAPGVIAERHFFYHVCVDPADQRTPQLDGSPLEAAGEVICVPLSVCLQSARQGLIQDAKTELSLRRLVEELSIEAGEDH